MTDAPTINAESELVARLREIEARANAAKPGPWKRAEYEHGFEVQTGPDYGVCSVFKNTDGGFGQQIDNLEFIAHAREDIPFLLATIERLASEAAASERSLRLANTVHEDHLQRAHEHGRREGIEMAAKVADSYQGAPITIEHPQDWAKHGERMSAIRIANKIRTLSTAPPEKGERIPSGWKLVPVEPTDEMLNAGHAVPRCDAKDGTACGYIAVWRAMLAASPPSPKAEDAYRTELGVVNGWLNILCGSDPDTAKRLNAFWLRSRVRAALAKESTP